MHVEIHAGTFLTRFTGSLLVIASAIILLALSLLVEVLKHSLNATRELVFDMPVCMWGHFRKRMEMLGMGVDMLWNSPAPAAFIKRKQAELEALRAKAKEEQFAQLSHERNMLENMRKFADRREQQLRFVEKKLVDVKPAAQLKE